MNLATLIDPHPADRPALISRGKATTYGELRHQTAGLRGGLAALGLEPGDRVAIVAANNWFFVTAYLAVLGAGCVAVPMNPTSPPRELERELAMIGARAIVVGPAGTQGVAAVDRGRLPMLEHVIASQPETFGDAIALVDVVGGEPVDVVDRDPDDLAALLFTSGTAGAPRAAMLTHGNLLANLDQCQRHPGRAQTADDVVFGVLPFFHIFGLNVVLGLSFAAGSAVLAIERFDPASSLESIKNHGCTVVTGAPTMWTAWAALPDVDREAMQHVRLAVSGAAKLPTDTRQAIRDRFGVDLREGYGLTEASPVVATASGTDAPDGSIGIPVPGVEVRLVDGDGGDVLVGDAGEIWVRGPNVFGGYWEDPEATRNAMSEDGWLRTGDVGVVDDDGYLYLVDRVKDLVIVSGFNVFPAEVEDVIALHPAVAAVAVVGVPHPYSGESVKAYVVPVDGESVEEDDIISHCTQHLARYKCPDKVQFVDALPLNVTGKVLRRALRA